MRGPKADRARWSRLAPFARKLTDYGAVWDAEGSRLYVFGGNTDYANSVSDELWQFDRNSNTWGTLSPSGDGPAGRIDHSTVWDSRRRRMYVFGGSWNEFFNDLWSYSPDENHWEEIESLNPAPPSAAQSGHACWAADGDRMLVCYIDGRVWSYAPSTRLWELLTAAGAPPYLNTSSAAWDRQASRVYIFGGWDKPMDARNDLWAFKVRGSRWEKLACGASLPLPRVWPGAVCDQSGRLYVFGGAIGSLVASWDDFWIYSPTNSSWQGCQTTGRGPRARFKPRLLFDDPTRTLFVLGGADQYALNDFWACKVAEPT